MQFSTICSSTFSHWQTQRRFAISTIQIRKRIFEFGEVHFSKWLTPKFENRGNEVFKNYVNSLSKRLIYFWSMEWRLISAYFKRYLRPKHLAGHKCDKKRFNVQSPRSQNGSSIDVFHNFWCKHDSSDGMEMTSIGVEMFSYSGSISSSFSYL